MKMKIVNRFTREANLWGANLAGADLAGANLRGADLVGAKIKVYQKESLFNALGIEVEP